MVKFWCPWCGETAHAASADLSVPCIRCEIEFRSLFGFTPRTDMAPLDSGEEPGEPAAATKRFTFYDAATGEPIGRTASAPSRALAG